MIVFCLTLVMVLVAAKTVIAQEPSLTITGNGVNRETTFSYSELERMTSHISQNAYSAWNTWPTRRTYYARGVSLRALLDQAGLSNSATTINIASNDGYNITFLLDDLLANRFSFEGSRTAVPAIIALTSGNRGFGNMYEDDFRLVFGQLDEQEQTTLGFVRSVRTITVTNAQVRQLPPPTATAERTAGGQYSVTLTSSNASAKIHYTTDGSMPTVHSRMFNISAQHWQPHLNEPFSVSGNTEVRAIAIAYGFRNSEVMSFTPGAPAAQPIPAAPTPATPTPIIPVASPTPTAPPTNVTPPVNFTDVPDSHWAAPEINALVEKGIIAGMGGGVFAPDRVLTRAQFANMMVRAVSGDIPSAASGSQFNDVAADAWYVDIVVEAARLGLFSGFDDGSFRPNDPVTKEQMLSVAVRALPDGAARIAAGGSAFANDGITPWAKDSVEAAHNASMISNVMMGTRDGLLSLDGTADGIRAEAAYVVYHLMQLLQ